MQLIRVLIVLAVLTGSVGSLFSCLTWGLGDGKLKLICRIKDLDLPVTFSDPLGRQLGRCTFTGVSSDCVSYHNNGNINSDTFTNEVIFMLEDISDDNINGNWTCSQDNNVYHTEVSTSEGISSSTDIRLTGEIRDPGTPNIITLKCFSCREPHRNSVEFLTDHISTDFIHYDHISRKCFHIEGECSADKCSCVPSGNEFTRILKIDNVHDSQYFSCGMRFIDNIKLITLVKYTTLFFDGKDFIFNGTETEVIYWNGGKSSTDISTNLLTTTLNPTVEKKDNITEVLVGTAIGVVVTITILIIWCVIGFRKSKEYDKTKKRSQTRDVPTPLKEEDLPLLPLDKCKGGRIETAVKTTQTILVISETFTTDPSSVLENNKVRWLLVGICFHNVITPALRTFVSRILFELYSTLKKSHAIDTQTHDNHLKDNPQTSKEFNYVAINHNKGCGQRTDMYDYRIRDAIELSKLYLPTELTDYKDFADVYDPFALLQILINIDICPDDTRSISEQICLKIRNQWPLCDFNEWNSEHPASPFKLMVNLLKTLQLESTEETRLTGLIEEFKENGGAYLRTSTGRNIESIKQQMNVLVDNVQKISQTDSHYIAALTELSGWLREIDDRMKEQRKQEEEYFRKLVFIIGNIAATVVRKFIGSKLLQPNYSDAQFRNYLKTNVHSLYHSWCSKKVCCQCKPDSTHQQHPESLLTKQQFQSMYVTDGKSVHFEHGIFCLCKVSPKENVSLQCVDVTIAMCFVKTLYYQRPDNGKTNDLQYLAVIKDCGNGIAKQASSKYFTYKTFKRRCRETEEAIVGLAKPVGDEFYLKTTNEIAALHRQQTMGYNSTHFHNILQQYRTDLAMMIHVDHEKRFKKKIDRARIKSGISHIKKLVTERKEDVLFAKTDNVRINILKYPEITKNEDRKTIEIVLQGDIPDNWDEYRMMETVRRMCEQITAGGNVIIKETTLEQFMMILEMLVEALRHEETLKKDIIGLFNKILKECNIDTSQSSVINVSMDPLPESITTEDESKTLIESDAVMSIIDELKLTKQWNVQVKENALITSIAVVEDDSYLLVDSNNDLLIFFNNYGVTKSIDLKNKPWSMALMDETTILISFPTKLEVGIFDIRQRGKQEFRKIDGKLHSMAKKDDSSVLICAEDLGVCLYNIVTNKLHRLNIELPDFVPNSDEICYRNELLYFSSRSTKKVFCYDLKGNKKWEFEHSDLKQPTTVTCDLYGNVYVTGYLSNNLFVIYDGGKSHRQLLTKEDHLKLPTFLYFCPKRKCLLIANRDNGFVARYDIIYKKAN